MGDFLQISMVEFREGKKWFEQVKQTLERDAEGGMG
jgi:hypothetical protein